MIGDLALLFVRLGDVSSRYLPC